MAPVLALSRAWSVVAVVAPLSFAGCSAPGGPGGPKYYWSYGASLTAFNLLGCPSREGDGRDVFALPDWKVLRHDERELVMYFHGERPATTLLLAVQKPGPSRRRSVGTEDGSLRAWLVRSAPEHFATPAFVDEEALLALADGSGSRPESGRVFPLRGRADIEFDADRVAECEVNLATTVAMPLYRELLQYEIDLFDAPNDYWREIMRADPRVTLPEEVKADRRLADEFRACLGHPRSAPASVKGEFRGGWVKEWRPPI